MKVSQKKKSFFVPYLDCLLRKTHTHRDTFSKFFHYGFTSIFAKNPLILPFYIFCFSFIFCLGKNCLSFTIGFMTYDHILERQSQLQLSDARMFQDGLIGCRSTEPGTFVHSVSDSVVLKWESVIYIPHQRRS